MRLVSAVARHFEVWGPDSEDRYHINGDVAGLFQCADCGFVRYIDYLETGPRPSCWQCAGVYPDGEAP